MKKEILQLEDIKQLVDCFYGKVRSDAVLAPVFNERIGDQWSAHMEKMYRFWQTALLGEHTYLGSPFAPHANLPVDKTHFTQWLTLFRETIDEHFCGEKAEEAKWRANKMAEMFQLKIAHYGNKASIQFNANGR
ncbi:MAG: group III truncated hemoglobin [Cyclobacteriaceae bacterium]